MDEGRYYHDVKAIRKETSEEEVNRLLQEGWELLKINQEGDDVLIKTVYILGSTDTEVNTQPQPQPQPQPASTPTLGQSERGITEKQLKFIEYLTSKTSEKGGREVVESILAERGKTLQQLTAKEASDIITELRKLEESE